MCLRDGGAARDVCGLRDKREGGGGADKKWNGPLDIGQVPLWKYSKTSTENHSKKRTKPTFIHLSQTSLINIVFVIRCKEHQSTMKELYFRAKGRRI